MTPDEIKSLPPDLRAKTKGQAFILSQLHDLVYELEKSGIVARMHYSKRGVPMILVEKEGRTKASIVYFGKTHLFRCFHPFPSDNQTKSRLMDEVEVYEYLEKLLYPIEAP